MLNFTRFFSLGASLLVLFSGSIGADTNPNQTPTTTPILSGEVLPFSISIETSSFQLPVGLHSGVYGTHDGKWLFLAGRTNGLHGFGSDPFPPSKQNVTAYVVDFVNEEVYSRDLDEPTSRLTQKQIDNLSVTSPQFFQNGKTLYISGGYGVDTSDGSFGTKSSLTAVDVPAFMKWVIDPTTARPAAESVRQTWNHLLRVTGGVMACLDNHLNAQLMLGQNFTGVYTPSTNGEYTKQVRNFQIIDNGEYLYVQSRKSESPADPYRRRDLNIVPFVDDHKEAYVALSGVFTLDTGIWTVPVEIYEDGSTYMADPELEETFKQGMNNYTSAAVTLHSPSTDDNFFLLLGGITYEYYDSGSSSFKTDTEFPFTNQVTTVKRDGKKVYSQYLMDAEYPEILSTGSNPGNQLLFGAGAFFVNAPDMPQYRNLVINLDKIKEPTVIGYVVGGIMSTLPNTNTQSDSTASPYIFKVTLNPN